MYQRELEVALEAARRAGVYLRQEYARFQAIPDAPADITTEADRRSQEIILQHLHESFPGDALCAEEKTPTLAAAAAAGARLWIVDPIDGTRGFAQKNGEFSVMVAFVHEGQLGAGVVLEPGVDRLTYASRAGGCWSADGDQAPQPCRVSAVAEPAQATLVQSRSRAPARSRGALALTPARIRESHSAGVKLARIARGEADVYLNTYQEFHDWDIAAGHILVTEAGGCVTGIAAETLHYGAPGAWQRHGLLATNGRLHAEALNRLAAAAG